MFRNGYASTGFSGQKVKSIRQTVESKEPAPKQKEAKGNREEEPAEKSLPGKQVLRPDSRERASKTKGPKRRTADMAKR